MLCKRCMVVMKAGTTYEQKGKDGGKRQISHKRFCQCPKCKDRIYTNFEEYLYDASRKNSL
jgi:hypothetical protein